MTAIRGLTQTRPAAPGPEGGDDEGSDGVEYVDVDAPSDSDPDHSEDEGPATSAERLKKIAASLTRASSNALSLKETGGTSGVAARCRRCHERGGSCFLPSLKAKRQCSYSLIRHLLAIWVLHILLFHTVGNGGVVRDSVGLPRVVGCGRS